MPNASAARLDPTSRYFPGLRHYRRRAGLTQRELARRAGFTTATVVSRVERGGYVGPVAETLIARALNLSDAERASAFGYPGTHPANGSGEDRNGYPGMEPTSGPIDLSAEREERRRTLRPETPVTTTRPGSGAL